MESAGDRFAKSSLVFAFLLMGFSFSVMQTLVAQGAAGELRRQRAIHRAGAGELAGPGGCG